MADYLSANCGVDENLIPIFPTYTDPTCNRWEGQIIGLFLVASGTTISCIQDKTEVDAAIAADKAVYLKGVGAKGDPSANTVDDPFPCGAGTITLDYSESLTFSAPVASTRNNAFFNQLRQNPSISQAFYVIKSGAIMELPESPSLSIGYGVEGDFFAAKFTLNWSSNSLETISKALGPVFGC